MVFWVMAMSTNVLALFGDPKCRKTCLRGLFWAASVSFILLFIFWGTCNTERNKQKLFALSVQANIAKVSPCQNQYRPPGSETLPKGIAARTSNLETRPLWGSPKKLNASRSLFTAAVGIKQKKIVDEMVTKFLGSNFVVMLFHYDGIVDGWKDFKWSNMVIHVSVDNQTKWWFAKRFLHPDIVSEYEYVFLWDEDLGVQNFNPDKYLSIVKREGFEISQPALDIKESEVHHLITARSRKSDVHRRVYKKGDTGIICDRKSTAPPCTGWIEMMAPVFSMAAWRCVWHMIQNDFVHAWGLDMRLGYCAQGDRTTKIGVVDSEYIVHHGIPTLGEPAKKTKESPKPGATDDRLEVRRQSYNEYKTFKTRWKEAAEEDKCWIDLYPDDDRLIQTSL